MIEMFTELGIVLGTSTGSILYGIGGYSLPFYVNAILMIIIALMIMKYIPSNKELKDIKVDESVLNDEEQ